MNIKAYKEYRFEHRKLVAADTGKEYTFFMKPDDRFYHYMEKHIMKEKVESLTYEYIDEILIEDVEKTFFNESSFTLNTIMLVTDKSNCVQAYTLTIKNVKLKVDSSSTKSYKNGVWRLVLYKLELPGQTDIDIVKSED